MPDTSILQRAGEALGISRESMGGILAAFDSNIDPLIQLTGAISVTAGVCLIIIAAKKMIELRAAGGQGQNATPFGLMTMFFVGVALLNLPTAMGTIQETMFNGERSPLSYSSRVSDWGESANNIAYVILHFIQFVGIAAFVRGMLILNKVANGGGQDVSLGKGLIFIVSGVLAANIVLTTNSLAKSFGLPFAIT